MLATVLVIVFTCVSVVLTLLALDWAYRKAEPSINRLIWRIVGRSGEPPSSGEI